MSFGFANPFRSTGVAIKPLPAVDAIKKVASGEITLIDIRDHTEVANTGKAKGAVHIPLFQLGQKADPNHPEFHADLSLDKPIAIYCATGARSQMAGRKLAKFGYTEIYNLGGLMHWQAAGGKCVR